MFSFSGFWGKPRGYFSWSKGISGWEAKRTMTAPRPLSMDLIARRALRLRTAAALMALHAEFRVRDVEPRLDWLFVIPGNGWVAGIGLVEKGGLAIWCFGALVLWWFSWFPIDPLAVQDLAPGVQVQIRLLLFKGEAQGSLLFPFRNRPKVAIPTEILKGNPATPVVCFYLRENVCTC